MTHPARAGRGRAGSFRKSEPADGECGGWSIMAGLLIAILPASMASAQETVLRGADLFDTGVIPAHVHVDMTGLSRPRPWRPGDPIKEIPQRKGVPRDYVEPDTARQPRGGDGLRALDSRASTRSGGRAFDTAPVNQDGSAFSGVNPPDPVGDIGNDHYIQMTNGDGTRVLVLDKVDGSTVANFSLRDLAEGSGTGCTTGAGDPIVMFDATADNGEGEPPGRWLLSEFTSVSLCIYISETSDPTNRGWFVYEFFSDSGGLPDYPKYAVWPDAYYVGANEDGSSDSTPGRLVYALDRENMLRGAPTRPTQVFEAPPLRGFGFQMLHPVDWDGAFFPPAGAPGLFLRHRDDEVHNAASADSSRDFVELWTFSVDWDNPANSTFSGPDNIAVADFESELCGLTTFACVPQPGSNTLLDPLREPMMWRAQYRNFGTHQAIVGSWVTDVAGGAADIHGVRWAELRDVGTGWTLHQQGTVSPDDTHRWMPSIAMDGSGNLAVGYNVSDGDTVFPGLRYTGRVISDSLDTMPIAEVSLVEGLAANSSNRYGDYSAMSVDPVDECTFWFTGEYNPAAQWSTRIGRFRFEECGNPNFILNGQPRALEACVASGEAVLPEIELEIGSLQAFDSEVTLGFDPPLPSDFDSTIDPVTVVPADPPAQSGASITVPAGAAPGEHRSAITGDAAGVGQQAISFVISVADKVPDAASLLAPGNEATAVALRPVFEWSASDQADSYRIELATDSHFDDIAFSEVVSRTAFQAPFELDSRTEYFWRVSPANQCGAGSAATASFVTGLAPGECPVTTRRVTHFSDDMESGADGWTHSADDPPDTWVLQSSSANSPVSAWRADSVAETSDQRLISPTIELPAGVDAPTLQFFTAFSLEESNAGCYDAGVVEYSDDDGRSWNPLSAERILDNPYTGTIEDVAGNPLGGRPGWCGVQPWTRTAVDLRGLEGSKLQFRFRLGTDEALAREDWLVDDVIVQSCAPEFVFADGFED